MSKTKDRIKELESENRPYLYIGEGVRETQNACIRALLNEIDQQRDDFNRLLKELGYESFFQPSESGIRKIKSKG